MGERENETREKKERVQKSRELGKIENDNKKRKTGPKKTKWTKNTKTGQGRKKRINGKKQQGMRKTKL